LGCFGLTTSGIVVAHVVLDAPLEVGMLVGFHISVDRTGDTLMVVSLGAKLASLGNIFCRVHSSQS
jgi:hypothetical protein